MLLVEGPLLPAESSSPPVEIPRIGESVVDNFFLQHIFQGDGTTPSFDALKELAGEERLRRICARPELQINLSAIELDPSLLTQNVTLKIFWGMADICLEDLEETCIQFNGCSIGLLTLSDLDAVYYSSLPFFDQSIDYDAHSPISFIDDHRTRGHGFEGLKERVWTILGMAKDSSIAQSSSDPETLLTYEMKEGEALSSRLADREMPKGTVLRLKDGLHAIKEVFSKGGSHIYAMHQLNNPRVKILCRGTALRRSPLSGVNDLLPEIGSLGIREVWPDLVRHLTDHGITEVDLIGKSLGGGHAQYLACLIGGLTDIKVRSLTTFASVGVPESVHAIYARVFAEKEEPLITRVLNWGREELGERDYVPEFGGQHLSALRGNTRTCQLIPQEPLTIEPGEVDDALPQSSTGGIAKKLFSSFSQAHPRQTTLRPFTVHVIESDQIPESSIRKLETMRQAVASVFNLITLRHFNSVSFEEYFQSLLLDT